MDKLRQIEVYLRKEYRNLNKSKHRPRTLRNIEIKTQLIQENFTEYKKLLKTFEHRISTSKWNTEVETYSALKLIVKQSIDILNNSIITRLDYESEPELSSIKHLKPNVETSLLKSNSEIQLRERKFSFKILTKIVLWYLKHKTKMALDIKTAADLATLIPSYDGNPGGMRSFTDAVTLAKTIVPAGNKRAAIQIILTKLSGKARNLFTDTPNEFDDIVTTLKANCGEKGNSDLALANLKNLKPKSADDVQNFTKQIDLLADTLAEIYVREQIPNDVAKKMAQKAAIQSLINGSTNKETKMMLKIGKFDNLQEAINVVLENEQTESRIATAAVLHTNNRQPSNYQNRNRYQNQNYFNRNPQMNGRYQQRSQQSNRYQSRSGNSNRNFNHNRNHNHNNRNNTYNSHRYFNRQYNPARMYYAQQHNHSGQPINGAPNQQEQPSYAHVVANNVPTNQQLPNPGNINPNYFLARQ